MKKFVFIFVQKNRAKPEYYLKEFNGMVVAYTKKQKINYSWQDQEDLCFGNGKLGFLIYAKEKHSSHLNEMKPGENF